MMVVTRAFCVLSLMSSVWFSMTKLDFAAIRVLCWKPYPAHNQMFVTKFSDKKTTETHMICLQESERIEELARLLAGDTLTESAIANARELLQISNS